MYAPDLSVSNPKKSFQPGTPILATQRNFSMPREVALTLFLTTIQSRDACHSPKQPANA
jgi:hypothetical protein